MPDEIIEEYRDYEDEENEAYERYIKYGPPGGVRRRPLNAGNPDPAGCGCLVFLPLIMVLIGVIISQLCNL